MRCDAWRGVAWRGVAWRGVAWRGVAWRGVAWRGVAWRGVAWRGVAWLGRCVPLKGGAITQLTTSALHHDSRARLKETRDV